MEEIVTVQDRKRKKFPVTKMIVYAVLVLYSIFLFAPILTILVSSFIPGDELARAEWYVWGVSTIESADHVGIVTYVACATFINKKHTHKQNIIFFFITFSSIIFLHVYALKSNSFFISRF